MSDQVSLKEAIMRRQHAAVLREDMARELAHEIKLQFGDKLEEVGCTGVDAVDVVNALADSAKFRQLIKDCVREVLTEEFKL